MNIKCVINKMVLPAELEKLLSQSDKTVIIPSSREELFSLATGNGKELFEVAYNVEGKGRYVEATVAKCKNGASVNYTEAYMRRRDPDSMLIADDLPTDKPKFVDKYHTSFEALRGDTFDWLAGEELILIPFMSGGSKYGYESLLVAPLNAAFFAGGLADLQEVILLDNVRDGFKPQAILYVAPTFRHTFFNGTQKIVHNRLDNMHELFCYNLYPGPSAKKGVYGILLNIGEKEGWVTAHASAVKVISPCDNEVHFMHEGASGGGKSEMLEPIHRDEHGAFKLAENTVTGEKVYVELNEESSLYPVSDDMALCHPSMQNGKKLVLTDAEDGWFLRVDHINRYGTDPYLERLCTEPEKPLIFLNIDGTPNATCLIWEHTMDEPGKPCPNPRIVMPRTHIPNIVKETLDIDVRSFGTRMPPSTKEKPTYGIMGVAHIIPPALAWIWRLVAPRGHANPSIVSTGAGMSSEGVGSYWAFATGKMISQANLLLEQIKNTPDTRYILLPNQHIGCYKVGFGAEWLAREYFTKKGGVILEHEDVVPARCTLLGFAFNTMKIDGQFIRKDLLQPELQSDMGVESYDTGAAILTDFFKSELEKFNKDDIDPLGKKIIELVLNDAPLEAFVEIIK